jgi:hypothetical protein
MYRFGAIALLFAGGLAVWVDATLSREWIAQTTNADKVFPGLSGGMSFILATLASAFGAIATNPFSWQILYMQSKKLAAISDTNERILNLIGYGFLSLFILGGFIFVYGVDLVSTFHKVRNFWLTVGIVFFGDLCFMLAVPLWMLSSTAKVAIEEFDSKIGNARGGQRTVNTNGRRFE